MNIYNSMGNRIVINSVNIGGLPIDPSLNNLVVTGYGENSIDISFNYTNIFKANINLAEVGTGSISTTSKNANFSFPLNVPNLNPGRTYNLNVDYYNKLRFRSGQPINTVYGSNPIYTLSKIMNTSVNALTTNSIDLSFVASDLSAIQVNVTFDAETTSSTFNRASLLSRGGVFTNNVLNGNSTIEGLVAGKGYSFGLVPYNYGNVPGATTTLTNVATLSEITGVSTRSIGYTTVDLSLNTSDLSFVSVEYLNGVNALVTRTFSKLDISLSATGSFNAGLNQLNGNITITGLTGGTNFGFFISPYNRYNVKGGVTNRIIQTTGSGVAFVPTEITGISLWLDANDLSSITKDVNENIIGWNDKSVNSRLSTKIGVATNNIGTIKYGLSKFNNLPGIEFYTGSTTATIGYGLKYPVPANTFTNGITIFIVFKKTNKSLVNEILIGRNVSPWHPSPIDLYSSNRYIGNGNTTSATLFSGAPNISDASSNNLYSITISSSLYDEYNNGISTFRKTQSIIYGDTNTTDITIGQRIDYNNQFNGVISEILLYNSVFTNSNRQKVEGYLAWKWGLQGNLPSDHFYKNENIYNPLPIPKSIIISKEINLTTTTSFDISINTSDLSYVTISPTTGTLFTFTKANLLTYGTNNISSTGILSGNVLITSLAPGTTYDLSFIPYNSANVPNTTQTLRAVTLSQINAIDIKAIGSTSIDISLNTSDLSYISITPTNFTEQKFYKIDISNSATGSFNANLLKGNVTITGLTPSTAYTINVFAVNNSGLASPTISLSAITNSSTTIYPTKSLEFTYTRDMYARNNNATYYDHSSITLEAWIKIPVGTVQGGTTTNETNLSNYSAIVIKQAQCAILVDRNNNLMYFKENSPTYPNGNTTLNVGDGKWHHVSVSLISGTNASAIYIDGVKKENFTWTVYATNVDLIIGNNTYLGNYRVPFVGKVTFFRFWKTNLLDSFIANNYNKYLSPELNTNLIGFYPMNEGSGTVLYNLAVGGSSQNLNITGNPKWITDNDIPTIYLIPSSSINSATLKNIGSTFIDISLNTTDLSYISIGGVNIIPIKIFTKEDISGSATGSFISNVLKGNVTVTGLNPATSYTLDIYPHDSYNLKGNLVKLKATTLSLVISAGLKSVGTTTIDVSLNTTDLSYVTIGGTGITTRTITKLNISGSATGSFVNNLLRGNVFITDLSAGKPYTFEIVPYNVNNVAGPVYNSLSCVTLSAINGATFIPNAATISTIDLSLNTSDLSYVTIGGTGVTTKTFTKEQIMTSINGNFASNVLKGTVKMTDLSAGKFYTFNITPYNINNLVGPVTNLDGSTISEITGVSVRSTGNTTVDLSLNASDLSYVSVEYLNDVNALVTQTFSKLVISGSATGGFNTGLNLLTGNVTITGLSAATNYFLNIYPYNRYNIRGGVINRVVTTTGGGVPFSPTDVSGVALWLDADSVSTITSSSNKVSRWDDRSVNIRHFIQSTQANQPTYTANGLNNKPVISFTSSNKNYLLGDTNANSFKVGTNSFAIFTVFKTITTTNASILAKSLYGNYQGRFAIVRESSSFNGFLERPTSSNSGGYNVFNNNITSYQLMSCIFNRRQGNDTMYVNGGNVISNTYNQEITNDLPNVNKFLLGGYNNNAGGLPSGYQDGYYLEGGIAEVIMYSRNTDITNPERLNIESYLANKWGLVGNLVAGHPGISNNNYNPPSTIPKSIIISKTIILTTPTSFNISLNTSDLSYVTIRPTTSTLFTFTKANLLTYGTNNISTTGILSGNVLITSLAPGTTYDLSFIPYNSADVSNTTQTLRAVTLSQINAASIKTIGSTTMDISLNTSDLSYVSITPTGLSEQKFYKNDISNSVTGSFDSITNVLKGNVTVTGLTESFDYTFTIKAINNIGMESITPHYSLTQRTIPQGLLKSIPTGSVGLYACKWVNNNYTGPIFQLRIKPSTADIIQDFYLDSSGTKIGTLLGGVGTSLANWIVTNGGTYGTTVLYVAKWYDQSKSGSTTSITGQNHATQSDTTKQPTIDLSSFTVLFKNTVTPFYSFLSIPNDALGTGNISWSITCKINNTDKIANTDQALMFFGSSSSSQRFEAFIKNSSNSTTSNATIMNAWYGNGSSQYIPPTSALTSGLYIPNNTIITYKYDSANRYIYYNKSLVTTTAGAGLNVVRSVGTIGADGTLSYSGSLAYFCLCNNSISDSDRLILENI